MIAEDVADDALDAVSDADQMDGFGLALTPSCTLSTTLGHGAAQRCRTSSYSSSRNRRSSTSSVG